MDDPKKHVIDTLKEANNILVTVKNSPTIDQLAACIALTLVINELGKHGTAVFSGQIPSALEFLEPEKTIEKNTNSLQDFIISLDKAKADKLRYKIEDTVVKIFITPYKTSLSPADLNFEPGDFNVDVVVALGVHNQDDVDVAITEHGKILHDATVLSINTEGGPSEDLGSIAWIDDKASSLSEMISEIANQLGKEDAIDNQVATALLTGIVAETERFGNNKTTPETMQVAAKLLTAGANQELVAAKLSEPEPEPEPPVELPAPVEEATASEAPASDQEQGAEFSLQNIENPGDGLTGLAEPAEEKKDDSDGSLEIEHPVTPLSAFAQENADFSIPQLDTEAPAEQNPADVQSQADGAESPIEQPLVNDGGGIPPIFDPQQDLPQDAPQTQEAQQNQPEQSQAATEPQGEQASFPQPPLETEEPAATPEPEASQAAPVEAVEQAEEQAALDFLKDRKVESHPRAVIQPLASQHAIIEPLHHGGALPDLAEGQNPDEAKFGLEPPTLGGTLTANLPNERKANSLEKNAVHHEGEAPILSHNSSKTLGTPSTPPVTPAPKEPAHDSLMSVLPQAPTPTLAELERQVHSRHEHKEEPKHPVAVQTASLITPLIDHTAPVPKPEEAKTPSKPASPPPPVPPPMPTPVS